jgi:hypothetical protein
MKGFKGLMGFYTTRWVEASTAEDAELIALEMLRSEFQFSEKQKQKAPDARVYFEEIIEVEPDNTRNPNSGATWFEM